MQRANVSWRTDRRRRAAAGERGCGGPSSRPGCTPEAGFSLFIYALHYLLVMSFPSLVCPYFRFSVNFKDTYQSLTAISVVCTLLIAFCICDCFCVIYASIPTSSHVPVYSICRDFKTIASRAYLVSTVGNRTINGELLVYISSEINHHATDLGIDK